MWDLTSAISSWGNEMTLHCKAIMWSACLWTPHTWSSAEFTAILCIHVGTLLLLASAHWNPICSFLYSAWGYFAGRNCLVPSFERLILKRIRIFFHSSDQTYKQKLFSCAIWDCSNICNLKEPQEIFIDFGGSLWMASYPAGTSLSSWKHGGLADKIHSISHLLTAALVTCWDLSWGI